MGTASAGQYEDGRAAYDRGDYGTALGLLGPLASEGNARAQFIVGAMYEFGLGVPQDYAKAVIWYRAAAEAGNLDAQFNLAGAYAAGHGVPRDYTEAANWYRRAADQGDDELAGLMPDVILASGGEVAVALHQFTQTAPIFAFFSGGGVSALNALVGTLAKPVGNVTGIFADAAGLTAKHCDLALEVVPNATRVGVLADKGNADNYRSAHEGVAAAALARKFTPVTFDAARPTSAVDLTPAFRFLADQRVDVIIVGSGFASQRAWVAQAAAEVRVPTIYNEQGYVEAGGLISYGFDRKAVFARLASHADLLLKGAKPSDLPVEQTTNYVMAINLKTAMSLGLTIPPSVLFRADLVIE